MEETKSCTKCGQVKPLSEFHFRKEQERHRADCRACCAERNRQNYQANREERIANQIAYERAHKEERAEYKRKYIQTNRERYDAYHAAYRDNVRESARQYFREYYQRNRSQVLEAKKLYRMNNRVAVRARNNIRKARQRNAPQADFTPQQWRDMQVAYDFRCAYCGEKPDLLTMDHVIPLAKGGSHTASNIVPACMPCNNHKKLRDAPPMVVVPDWSRLHTP